MNRLKRAAIVTNLAKKMRENGSWCGETHLQKALYLAQELLNVPTEYEFILYKHGPFSFDFRDDLASMQADRLLKIEPQQRPFGPRFNTTDLSDNIESKFPSTMRKINPKLNFVAEKLKDKGVAELEKLATALYVINLHGPFQAPLEEQAVKLHELKPHISLTDAQKALKLVAEYKEQIQELHR